MYLLFLLGFPFCLKNIIPTLAQEGWLRTSAVACRVLLMRKGTLGERCLLTFWPGKEATVICLSTMFLIILETQGSYEHLNMVSSCHSSKKDGENREKMQSLLRM